MNGMSVRTKQGKQLRQIHCGPSGGDYAEEPDGFSFRIGTIKPAKASGSFAPKLFRCPEARLMLAVLDDAIQCFLQYRGAKSRKEQKLFQTTRNWILSTESDWIFSFESVCEIVKIDPSYIRDALLKSGAARPIEGRNRSPLFFTRPALAQDKRARAWSREHQVSSAPMILRRVG